MAQQNPLFPLSPEQRMQVQRELVACVIRYRAVESAAKAAAKANREELKLIRGLMEAHAGVLYDTDDETQKVDIDRLIQEIRDSQEEQP